MISQICEPFSKLKFSLPYLDSAWEIHLNEYKQAQYWCSGFWDNSLNFVKLQFFIRQRGKQQGVHGIKAFYTDCGLGHNKRKPCFMGSRLSILRRIFFQNFF